ncbi:porin [Pseudoduganella umbonata]|uniref:Putative porin n=1 Tax=Pseudoduganella umbonata TaxID=864828 RepID=A0A7W5HBP3_9BURK|nr:porin [Pseudoduganella umbonata]MBB3221187.1 putative porin [Pseudoduganella umbonata]
MKSKIRSMAAAMGMAMGAGVPLVAAAQSVTLYGVLDTGVEYVNHVGPAGKGLARVPTITGTFPSRWGLRGSEDLGGGLKTLFVLESGIGMDSGSLNQGGRLFGLQAWVGLGGTWGQVSVGRQLSMLLWALQDTDVMGPNIYGIGAFDNYLPNARADNTLAYKGSFGGMTVGATYSPGRDTVNAGPSPSGMNCAGETPGSSRTCRAWSALLAYKADRWGANAAVDTSRGGPGAFGGLVRSDQLDQRITAGGYLRVADGRIAVNWIRRANDAIATPRSDVFAAGLSYDVAPGVNVAGQLAWLRYRGSADKAALVALRGTYALGKRTMVYATSGFIDNDGQLALSVSGGAPGSATAAGATQFGTMLGVRHAF